MTVRLHSFEKSVLLCDRVKRLPHLVVLLGLASVALLGAHAGAAPAARQACPAGSPPLKILINQDGWYRTTVDSTCFAASNPNIHLTTGGQDVSFQLNGGTLEFYGQALDTQYSDTRTYWLSLGATSGARMQVVSATGPTTAPTGTYTATATLRERTLYRGTIVNGQGNNIYGSAITSSPSFPRSRTLTIANADTSQAGTLRVDLHGYRDDLHPATSHTINVSLNGTALGSVTGTGQNPMSATFAVPGGLLVNGANTVLLTNTDPASTVLIDTFTLRYEHFFLADSNALAFTVSPSQTLSVGGFTPSSADVRVVDITNPIGVGVRELTPARSADRIGIIVPNDAFRLYAFTDANVRAPKQVLYDTPSSLKTTGNQADLIVISHANFKTAVQVQALVNLRISEGLAVDVVDVQDVFDEFGTSFGAKDPLAIREFLEYAKNNWANPKPKYVLLVGDGTYDPRNYLGLGTTDFIPALFVDAGFAPEPPSDDALADFNGDGLPELAVGRLPVNTEAEANAMALKIVGYASSTPRAKSALLVSDNNDRNDYVFRSFSDDLQFNALIPSGVSPANIVRVDRTDSPPANPNPGSDQAKHDEVVAEASEGPTIVNWFGHGTVGGWNGSPPLLHAVDVPNLTNVGKLSLYLMMTCQNAYYVNPQVSSLAEALLRGANGAFAVWGSSGDTVPTGQVVAAKEATKILLTDPSKRLGDAMLVAKAAVSDIDVRRTWTLIGDPTSRLKFLTPTSAKLKSFAATRAASNVRLRWRTATESDALGFNVYRVAAGKSVKVNRAMVVAKRSGTTAGASYTLVDKRVLRGTRYTYRLQIVSLDGSRSWAAASTIRTRR